METNDPQHHKMRTVGGGLYWYQNDALIVLQGRYKGGLSWIV